MVEELLAILAAYGIGIGLVHWFQWRCHWGRLETSHAVIVTRDAGATVEWHLRRFALAQYRTARYTKVTLIDEGSTDETVRIAERLIGWHQANWELIAAGTPSEAQRLLEQLGEAKEVLEVRGPLAGSAGQAI